MKGKQCYCITSTYINTTEDSNTKTFVFFNLDLFLITSKTINKNRRKTEEGTKRKERRWFKEKTASLTLSES